MKIFRKSYHEIITVDKLLRSWQNFLSGKKEKNDVAVFQAKLADNIFSLYHDLINKIYIHQPYVAFNISDPKPRNIHKATVRDRLLHRLLYDELYGYFDSKFIYDSYSCRLNKGTHRALARFDQLARRVSSNHTKICFVLKGDIRKFFASIDHAVLKTILTKYIIDQDILWLLNQIIDSFYVDSKQNMGLPLGNLTSQLLVNVYMNEFDQFVVKELKAKYYSRYADDFVIFSRDKNYLKDIIPKLSIFLQSQMKLTLHPQKLFIKTLSSGVDWLGWTHFSTHKVLRTTTKKRMLKKLKTDVNKQTTASYLGMLKHGDTHKLQRIINNQAT